MSELAAAARRTPAAQSAFRVLVVDDDPDMATLLKRTLEKEGMAADMVYDGDAALVRAMSTPPDLIVLDVLLPGLSGFDICERLKADEITALVPIILVTSLEDPQSRVRGIEAGADDFLSKPVKIEELIARVKTLRRLHETRRELEARRLGAEVQRKEAIRRAFSRYISPRLAERIISDLREDGLPFDHHAQRISVVALFADLRGFTRLTETIDVDKVVGMLNEYFAVITEAAYRNDGTIFSMAGDCLLVGFNVPFPQADAALRAWRTAEDMIAGFAPVLAGWTQGGGMPTGVGIGIATGEAIIGNIGSPHHMSYTIIGDAVNTAARLMQMARAGELLVSGSVYDSIRALVPEGAAVSRGNVALRGKTEPTPVYSIELARPRIR
ncbi:MAG TPA: response regulator [Burkholderiales bacterium]|nr:response regulator [Burkholderiales bacterium]